MPTKWKALMLAAALGSVSFGARRASAAPAPGHDDSAPAAAKPQSPEIRPGSPADESLKRLVGQRTSHKGITLSSGPATRPHKVLGAVRVEGIAAKGSAGATPGPDLYLNELLRNRAVQLYGEQNVDGIMSITYKPTADGKVQASGTAVHFEPQGGKETK